VIIKSPERIDLLFQSEPAIHVQTYGPKAHQYLRIEFSSLDIKKPHYGTSPNVLPFHFLIPNYRISDIINFFLLLLKF
jgi:hypothetical protein